MTDKWIDIAVGFGLDDTQYLRGGTKMGGNQELYIALDYDTNQILKKWNTPLAKKIKFILKYYPDFNNILRRYGSVQIRNVGTIGGNIATASPIGDTLPLLLSLNAKIIIQTKKGYPLRIYFELLISSLSLASISSISFG